MLASLIHYKYLPKRTITSFFRTLSANIYKAVSTVLVIVITMDSASTWATAQTKITLPPCEDVLQIIERGELEKALLSQKLTEEQLIQFLMDHKILMSPIFFKAWAAIILPNFFKNGIPQDNTTLMLMSLKKMIRFIKNRGPISKSSFEKLLDQMVTVAAKDGSNEFANRTLHLMISRAINSIKSSEQNYQAIRNIYSKAIKKSTLAYLLSLEKELSQRNISFLRHLTAKSFFKSFLRNSIIAFTVPTLASIPFYGIPSEAEITTYGTISLFFSCIFSIIFYDLNYIPKYLDFSKFIKINQIFSDVPHINASQLKDYLNQSTSGVLTNIEQVTSQANLSDFTFPEIAYMGQPEILALNEKFKKLNESFQSSLVITELNKIRTQAQNVVVNPESYRDQMNLVVSIRESVALIQSFLKDQQEDLKTVASLLRKIKSTIANLRHIPYRTQNMEREDIAKGEILVGRLEKELKTLEAKAGYIITISEKLVKLESLEKVFKNFEHSHPNSKLEWEEFAKAIALEIDRILLEEIP